MLAIQTNLASLAAQRHLATSQNAVQGSLAKLSSGFRINGAKDDAAGLGITMRLSATAVSSKVALRGIQDGISLVQTAEGALGSIHDLLQRARELATQAANGSLTDRDRGFIATEFAQIREEIDQVAKNTKIFGKTPLYEPSTYTTTTTETERTQDVTETLTTYTVANARVGTTTSLKVWFADGGGYTEPTLDGAGSAQRTASSGVAPIGIIPAGTQNLRITLDSFGADDDLQLFTRDGVHLAGTPPVGAGTDYVWNAVGVNTTAAVNSQLLTTGNGFQASGGAPVTYTGTAPLLDSSDTSGRTFVAASSNPADYAYQTTYNGISIAYSGDGDRFATPSNVDTDASTIENVVLGNVTEPLFLAVVGSGAFNLSATWDAMPTSTGLPGGTTTTLPTRQTLDYAPATVTTTVTTVTASEPVAPPPTTSSTLTGPSSTATTVSGDVTSQVTTRTDTLTQRTYDASYVRNPPPNAFHIDVVASANVDDDVTTIRIEGAQSDSYGLGLAFADLGTADGARSALDTLDAAIRSVSEHRATYGALQNRLEAAHSNLSLQLTTTETVRGRIRDVDVADESSRLSSHQVVAQSAIAILAQGNKNAETALSLVRG